MEYILCYSSPLGILTVAATQTHITGLWIEGQKYFCASLPEITADGAELPLLKQAADWLDRYFAEQAPSAHALPLLPRGTAF